jgi:hypothetical protein
MLLLAPHDAPQHERHGRRWCYGGLHVPGGSHPVREAVLGSKWHRERGRPGSGAGGGAAPGAADAVPAVRGDSERDGGSYQGRHPRDAASHHGGTGELPLIRRSSTFTRDRDP